MFLFVLDPQHQVASQFLVVFQGQVAVVDQIHNGANAAKPECQQVNDANGGLIQNQALDAGKPQEANGCCDEDQLRILASVQVQDPEVVDLLLAFIL